MRQRLTRSSPRVRNGLSRARAAEERQYCISHPMHSLLVFACAAAVVAQEDVVETPLGTVRGVVTDRARAFIGLPYAAPPVGSLRWKPTQPVAPWKPSVLEAFSDPPGCPQDCVLPPHTCPGTTAESCLFLSVYTPRLGNYSTPAPVMIFIHGALACWYRSLSCVNALLPRGRWKLPPGDWRRAEHLARVRWAVHCQHDWRHCKPRGCWVGAGVSPA